MAMYLGEHAFANQQIRNNPKFWKLVDQKKTHFEEHTYESQLTNDILT